MDLKIETIHVDEHGWRFENAAGHPVARFKTAQAMAFAFASCHNASIGDGSERAGAADQDAGTKANR